MTNQGEKSKIKDAADRDWKADDWPLGGEEDLKFTLVYEGELLAYKEDRAPHKHSIRKQFHPQLRLLWEQRLNHWMTSNQVSGSVMKWNAGPPMVEQIAWNFQRGPFQFVPLVTEKLVLACKLNILFLRREVGLGRIVQGGDIDNRLKTLFDALRMPKTLEETGGLPLLDTEKPFFCLLEDDALITEVRVRADTLLTPTEGAGRNDVKLIIGVTVKPIQTLQCNTDFA
ncbi:hypothetical protein ACFPT7_23270 [Acidicapsa dinghuensis]|uniref:Uncharacterized protein n=3 Tax=Acidicapsa dinghuensis TaxID=2218256 RepID=A0ABW1EMH3_9BACT